MNKRILGKEKESLAISFLEENGYEILDRNFYYRGGEIDIIATCKSRLKFIEVKYRSSDLFGFALESITKRKILNILKGVNYYIYSKNINMDYDIEIVAIDKDRIEIIKLDSFN